MLNLNIKNILSIKVMINILGFTPTNITNDNTTNSIMIKMDILYCV